MRVVYHAEGIVDAHLVKDALDHAGIPAFISGEYLIGGVGQLPARDFLAVSVPDVFVEDSGPVVREITDMLRAPVAEEPQPEDAKEPDGTRAIPPLRLRPWPA
ncbi:MAG: putative signal transducing protein [Rhodanobacteraceae bacterium]